MAHGSRTDIDALIASAQAGGEDAMQELLAEVQPQIYRFGMRVCRNEEDARDVLQETLLSMARKLHSFQGTSSLSTWAYTIARNHCLKHRRKHPPPTAEPREDARPEPASEAQSPEAAAETREGWERVAHSIARLAPDNKEVLVLRDIEGLSAAEVAEVVGISVAAVKSRLHRARRDLRSLLSEGSEEAAASGCPDIVGMFSRHQEDDLSPSLCEQMQKHVDGCARCRSTCDALKADLQLCRTAPAQSVPTELQSRIKRRVKELLQLD